MRELIEHFCWWLAYGGEMDIPVSRELAMRVVEQWTRHEEHGPGPVPAPSGLEVLREIAERRVMLQEQRRRNGAPPRPAADEPTSGDSALPGG